MSHRRVAIVTGGTGGMGPTIGLALARRGLDVVFAQRGEAAAAVAAIAAAVPSARALSLPLDVSTRAGVQAFFRSFSGECDRLDVLVNVSGECPRTAIGDVREEEMSATLAVNVAGPFWMCQAARPLMWASGGGAIVNIGSLAGEDGANAASIAYTIAKAGLRGMMMQLAKNGFAPEAADAIAAGADRASLPLVRVNDVSPGPVATAMLASMTPAELARITASTLTGKTTTVEEVAAAVVYLALDAHNVTGQTLQLSGGAIRS